LDFDLLSILRVIGTFDIFFEKKLLKFTIKLILIRQYIGIGKVKNKTAM